MAGEFDVSANTVDPDSTIPDAILDKFEEVFTPDKAGDTSDNEVDVATEPAVVSPREAARRAAAKKEQDDELIEEGLVGVDNPDGDAAPDEEAAPTEVTDDEVVEEEPAVEEAAPLDPNLRFAAQQFGWTDAKIDRLLKADPELATETFSNLLSAYTNLSRQYTAPPQQAPQNPAAPVAPPESQLDKLYRELAAFGEENGNSIVERFLKPLQSEIIEPFRKMQALVAQQQEAAVAAEVHTAFSSLTDKFGDVYGQDDSKLTLPQRQTRTQLASLADQIRAGASVRGETVSVKEALNRAHLIVTADKRVSDGRKQVIQQVHKRAKSITARPTQRSRPNSASEVRSDKIAAEAFVKRAEELGLEVE